MDAHIVNMIDARQEANKELIKIISDIVEKNPDLRFGQILVALGIIEGTFVDGVYCTKDPFYEEPVITLERIKAKQCQK
jgi:hypothetical protein